MFKGSGFSLWRFHVAAASSCFCLLLLLQILALTAINPAGTLNTPNTTQADDSLGPRVVVDAPNVARYFAVGGARGRPSLRFYGFDCSWWQKVTLYTGPSYTLPNTATLLYNPEYYETTTQPQTIRNRNYYIIPNPSAQLLGPSNP